MSNFLDNLIARNMGAADVLQPRLASLFEPAGSDADLPAAAFANTGVEAERVEERVQTQIGRQEQPRAGTTPNAPGEPFSRLPPASSRLSQSSSISSSGPPGIDPSNRDDRSALDRTGLPAADQPSTAHAPVPLQPPASAALSARSARVEPLRPERNATRGPSNVNAAAGRLSDPDGVERLNETISVRSGDRGAPVETTGERSAGEKFAPGGAMEQTDRVAAPVDATRAIAPEASDTIRIRNGRDEMPYVTGRRQREAPPAVQAQADRSSPVIKVTIGRIDVRATTPAPAPARRQVPVPKSSALSLDEYLKQRSGGKR